MVGLDIAEKPGMFSEEQLVVCLTVEETGKSGNSKNLEISQIFSIALKARSHIY
jgi:hypothetical protein